MRTLVGGLLCLLLAVPALAQKEPEKKVKPKADDGKARVAVVGALLCAHCDLSIGSTCATGLRTDNKTAFVVEGKAGQELFDQRKGSAVKRVVGTLTVKDGNLVLAGQEADDADDKSAKGKATVVGTLAKADDGFVIKNGAADIQIGGKTGKNLGDLAGKKVKAIGVLSLGDESQVVLTAYSVEVATDEGKKKKEGAYKGAKGDENRDPNQAKGAKPSDGKAGESYKGAKGEENRDKKDTPAGKADAKGAEKGSYQGEKSDEKRAGKAKIKKEI